MIIDSTPFVFIITLAGVVNGLGIVRWLTIFTEYIKRRSTLNIPHYWVFSLSACFQFLLHIGFWWTLWSFRGAATINFLSYLFLLSGPILIFVGTSLIMPSVDDDEIDLKAHYFAVRPAYSTALILLWVWSIFLSPVLRGAIAPTLPIILAFLANSVVMRVTPNPKVHAVTAVINWLLCASFIGFYFIQLGGWTN